MYLGKVIGNVVCTIKDEALVGIRLMLVERLYGGGTVVALDAVGSGPGETVYVCRGKEASENHASFYQALFQLSFTMYHLPAWRIIVTVPRFVCPSSVPVTINVASSPVSVAFNT